MKDKSQVPTAESTQAEKARADTPTLRPPVNVFEDAEGITLEADMPGVSKERLQVHVDKDSLLIEGDIQVAVPEAMEALYADVRATRYSRSFALSRELDTENIEAASRTGCSGCE